MSAIRDRPKKRTKNSGLLGYGITDMNSTDEWVLENPSHCGFPNSASFTAAAASANNVVLTFICCSILQQYFNTHQQPSNQGDIWIMVV